MESGKFPGSMMTTFAVAFLVVLIGGAYFYRVQELGFMAAVAVIAAVMWRGNQKAHDQALFKVEAERRKSEGRYHAILLSVGDAVMVTDVEGRVELLNPVAEELTGWRQAEACGRPIQDVFHAVNEETRQRIESPVCQIARGRGVGGPIIRYSSPKTEWNTRSRRVARSFVIKMASPPASLWSFVTKRKNASRSKHCRENGTICGTFWPHRLLE